MKFDFTQYISATMVMFAVIDIFGSIPIILDVKRKAGDINPLKITLVSLGIMIGFLFLGESILKFLGLNISSFAVAGSLVLLFLALEMILGIELFKQSETSLKSASIVPLAFPIIAGAGSMTTIISLRAEYEQVNVVLAIITNMIVVFTVLKLTGKIEKLLGDVGVAILQKVFGIILLAIAVKLFSHNAKLLFE